MKKTFLLSTILMLGATGVFAQDADVNPYSEYEISPASGENLNEISEISVTFPLIPEGVDGNWDKWINIYAMDLAEKTGTVTLTSGDKTVRCQNANLGDNGLNYRKMTFTFPTVTDEGNWKFTIPADFFRLYGYEAEYDSPEITADYTVSLLPPEEIDMNVYTLTPTPDTEVRSLEEIMLTFPESGRDGIGFGGGGIWLKDRVYLRNLDTDKITYVFNREDYLGKNLEGEPDPHSIVLFFQEYGEGDKENEFVPSVTENGEYELVISERIFYAMVQNDMLPLDRTFVSPRITARYTLKGETSVTAPEAVSDTVTVTDLAGRTLLRGADRSALRTLDAGLYVINGKKVVIRK